MERRLRIAARLGNVSELTRLLENGADVCCVNREGKSALAIAAEEGNLDACKILVEFGAPITIFTKDRKTVGELAARNRHGKVYEYLVREGAAALSSQLRSKRVESRPFNKYLSGDVSWEDEGRSLVSESGSCVMSIWEKEVMEQHAAIVCDKKRNRRILNIGYGMGLVDAAIAVYSPLRHTIIEAHPKVAKRARKDSKDFDVREGRWQDVCPRLIEEGAQFDGIMFDTFEEGIEDLLDFQQKFLPKLLAAGGVYSFFNAVSAGPPDPFFHDVGRCLVEGDLNKVGIRTRWIPLKVAVSKDDDQVFGEKHTRSGYWLWMHTYFVPICVKRG